MTLSDLLKKAKSGATILDYGCFGWKLIDLAKRDDLNHHGCDIMMPDGMPKNAVFHLVHQGTQAIDAPDDYFDIVVASHVIEHVHNPIHLFSELARVCKPLGIIYIEAPSDRSLTIRSDPKIHRHSFYSFWDDPTHIRPWTPAALYRLAISHGYIPLETRYLSSWKAKILYPFQWVLYSLSKNGHRLTDVIWQAKGWACCCVIQKPMQMKGAPKFKYLSLKDVPPSMEAALKRYHHS
ncbi:MAG: class I SAM-dependent methyltransferase [Holosporales bacterium]|jgi:SAM-dependent methyltransferase